MSSSFFRTTEVSFFSLILSFEELEDLCLLDELSPLCFEDSRSLEERCFPSLDEELLDVLLDLLLLSDLLLEESELLTSDPLLLDSLLSFSDDGFLSLELLPE